MAGFSLSAPNYAQMQVQGCGVPTPKDVSPSLIRDEITGLENGFQELHQIIEETEQRLTTVLRPVPPSADNINKTAPGPCESDVLMRLHGLSAQLIIAKSRLIDINKRVEV